MSREILEEEFDTFLDAMVAYARDAFSPTRAATGHKGLGDRLLKGAFSRTMDEELASIRRDMERQRDVVLDYVEDDEADVEEYRDRFLRSDFFYQHYKGDKADEFEEVMMQRLEEVANDMAPLVEVGTDDFWEALEESYDRREAEEILKYHFSFTDKIVEEFGDGLRITFSLGPVSIPYTSEALRVMPKAEGHLRRQIVDKLDETYGERGEDESGDGKELEELEKENEELRQELERLRQEEGAGSGEGGDGTDEVEADGGA